MNSLPIALKVVFNLVFFVIYAAVAMFLVALILGIFMGPIWWALSDRIAVFIALLVLLVSFFFRKYFYLSLAARDSVEVVNQKHQEKKSYTAQKKEQHTAQTTHTKKWKEHEDDIKIYVEKEIK